MGLRPRRWSPVTLGIFVEGPSDRSTIPILICKLGYRSGVHARWVRGAMLGVSEMSNQVSALLATQPGTDRILIFIDSEGVDPARTLERTHSVSNELNRIASSVPVSYIVVDHSLEGWLACEVDAVKAVLGRNATVRIRGNPEDNPRPAKVLERVFRSNGKTFKKTVDNPKIAHQVNPEVIAQKSPTFRRLVDILAGQSP